MSHHASPPFEKSGKNRAAGWLIGFLLAAALVLIPPFFIKRDRKIDVHSELVGNARNIGLALFEFESVYGFPLGTETEAKVKQRVNTPLTLGGSSSNEIFTQLLAAKITQSERMF